MPRMECSCASLTNTYVHQDCLRTVHIAHHETHKTDTFRAQSQTHTRDFWKATVRKKPLPAVLRKGADGKFAVDPLYCPLDTSDAADE